MTLQELRSIYINTLASLYDSSEATAIFEICTEHILHTQRPPSLSVLTNEQVVHLEHLLTELRKGVPVQYVTGTAYFWDTFYKVSSATLIPRPETEELLFWLQQDTLIHPYTTPHILDIGTGTGCIAITAQKILPDATVSAMDVSEAALAITQHNAASQGVAIHTIHDNILEPSPYMLQQKWDIIISNPPYITVAEQATMHPNVLENEPHQALFVTNNDPQQFYRAIAGYAQQNLHNQGTVYLELNALYARETATLWEDMGFSTQLRKDMQGKDRMLKAWRASS